jgi:hypothetical protein
MDLTIPIIGIVSAIGYYINDKSNKTVKKNIRTDMPENMKVDGNVYESNMVRNVQLKEKAMLDKNYKDSLTPGKTKVIPPLYNTLCKTNCDTNKKIKIKNLENSIMPKVKPVDNKYLEKREKRILNGPLFEGSTIVKGIDAEIRDSSGTGFDPIIKQGFDNVLPITGINEKDARLPTMVPFFGGSVKQNMSKDLYESKLELYTGKDYGTFIPKKEQGSLFKPYKQNIYGNKPFLDTYDKSRVAVSNNKNGIIPFPQYREKPLPQDLARARYKTVDELRTKSNPKMDYKEDFRPSPAFSPIVTRNTGKLISNKKHKTVYAKNSVNYSVPTSNKVPIEVRENYKNLKHTSRNGGVTTGGLEFGGASKNNFATYIPYEEYGPSHEKGKNKLTSVRGPTFRNSYKNDWVRNAGYNISEPGHMERYNHYLPEQERETTNRLHMNPAGKNVEGHYVSKYTENDVPVTNKQLNLYDYIGAAETEVKAQPDYTAEYNTTREKQYIGTEHYMGNAYNTHVTDKSNYQEQYKNIENFSNKEQTMVTKYTPQGLLEKSYDKSFVNIQQKNDSLIDKQYNFSKRVNNSNSKIIDRNSIMSQVSFNNNKTSNCDITSRIDPDLLKSFNSNPYTQSLHSS